MLYYLIPKIANYKDKHDDCTIGINYKPKTNKEYFATEYRLSQMKRDSIAEMLGLNKLFVIPITRERYLKENRKR